MKNGYNKWCGVKKKVPKTTVRPAIHLSRPQNAKNEKCIVGYFVTFFTLRPPFFAFRISQYFATGLAFTGKVKGFCGLFFLDINKTRNSHEIWKECILNVSYFVVCFVKTFAKYPRNMKCKKCIASL